MRINKLNDNMFYNFASKMIGVDVRLYKDYIQMKRTDKGVKIKMYVGGELEDQRKILFQDTKCLFKNYALRQDAQDVSYDWVQFVLEYADELTEDEKEEIVDEYNQNLENEIENYASKKRQNLISI
ncbi:MAG: hypothetical protein J6Q13_01245 [Clostridia bacterium]|nr:hypothetical protein [Clostridia bacterium]